MRPDWFKLVRLGNAWENDSWRPRVRTVGRWARLRRFVRALRLWGVR